MDEVLLCEIKLPVSIEVLRVIAEPLSWHAKGLGGALLMRQTGDHLQVLLQRTDKQALTTSNDEGEEGGF